MNSFNCHTIRTPEKTIADSLPIENLSENPGPREIIKVGLIIILKPDDDNLIGPVMLCGKKTLARKRNKIKISQCITS